MNKLLVFPMAFMFMLTLFSAVFSTYHPQASSGDFTGEAEDEGTTIQGDTGNVTVPKAKPQSFNIWNDATGALVILVIAIAIGIIAGIKILGSGLSDMSQNLIFNGILFLGLWAVLTVVSSSFLFEEALVSLLWVALTVIYIIGMGIHLNGAGATS